MSEELVRSDADVRHPRSMRLVSALATDYLSALDKRSSGEVHHVATGLVSNVSKCHGIRGSEPPRGIAKASWGK